MRVKLKVLHGSGAGRLLSVSGGKFVIGRGEECQLRPRSDVISRKHCALVVTESQVILEDYGSKNGTHLNGERVEGNCGLKSGDQLKIGPLEFEVLMDHKLGDDKRPKVKDMQDVVSRSVTAPEDVEDNNISSWLEEADEVDRDRRMTEPETRQYQLDDTDQVEIEGQADADADTKVDEPPDKEIKKSGSWRFGKSSDTEKKEPGKLPKDLKGKPKDSREAAEDMLKKFFNNRSPG